MNAHDYLKLAIQAKCHHRRAWFVSAFSMIQEAPDAWQQDPYDYRLVQTPTGYSHVVNEKLIPIDDSTPPLFRFTDRIKIDSSWIENIAAPTEVTLGNLLVNLLCLSEVFGKKLAFVTGKVSLSKIEDEIASRLQDTPPEGTERSALSIYVDEYVKFVDRLQFVAGLSQLCVYSATPKIMVPAPGVSEYKQQLLAEYGDRLKDPSVLAEFEQRLAAYDDTYLKDDPTYGIFMSGKIKNISRKKAFLDVGAEQGFEPSSVVTPVTNALSEGWPTEANQFTALMNGSRYGSFSRGHETMRGGVTAKVVLRSSGNFKIIETDCGTSEGIQLTFTHKDIAQLVGRTIWKKTGWLLIDQLELAQSYIGTPVTVRSPMYCLLEGDAICRVCAGERLALNPNGVASALSEVAAIILTTSLKAIHGKTLTTAPYRFQQMLS